MSISRGSVKWLRGILVFILVIALVHGVATYIMGRRVEQAIAAIHAQGDPVSMSELAEPRIPDSENGAVEYMKAFAILKANSESFAKQAREGRWSAGHAAPLDSQAPVVPDTQRLIYVETGSVDRMDATAWRIARSLVAADEPAVRLIAQAQMKPRCRFAANWQDGLLAVFPYLPQTREATRRLGVRALVHARDGRMDDAGRDLEMSTRMTDAIRDESLLIHQLTRIAVSVATNSSVQRVSQQHTLSAAQCSRLSATLAGLVFDRPYRQAMIGERAGGISAFPAIINRRVKIGVILDPGARVSHAMELILPSYAWRPFLYADELASLRLYERVMEITAHPYREIAGTGLMRRFEAEIGRLPRYCVITRACVPVFGRVVAQRDVGTATVRGCGVYLGLTAYKDRYGAYPRSLNELRSKLGWKVGEDPFSGKPFVYRRIGDGFVLYSIGKNLRDDRGVSDRKTLGRRDGGLDDIAWRDPAAEQALQSADQRPLR